VVTFLQFSGTMKQTAVTELEGVLAQISKLLKESKVTFRKNR
jgi:C4-type Zn-finger protein